jgi:tetratricopeptide (TPR) repeat protein
MYAKCLFETGNRDMAEQQYALAIRLTPDKAAPYLGLAEMMLDVGEYGSALKILEGAYNRVDFVEKQAIMDMITRVKRQAGA